MSPLSADYLEDGRWRLTGELLYEHKVFGNIVVPAGTVTDLDSVPRLPFAYWLVKNRSVVGATVHDYLYFTGELHGKPISRSTADKIFLDVMVDEGVAWWQRRLIWLGVRAGGFLAWRKHRNAKK